MSQTTTPFAAATQPITQDTLIVTDTVGLRVGEIQLASADVAVPAYFAAPEGPGPHPIVLVAHEIFGLHEHIRDVARRLAKLGYLAVAPELFARHGNVPGLPIEEVRPIAAKVADAEVFADLDLAYAWASANGGDAERLAITGFCWGGRITWLYSAHQPKVKAGVAWYGRLVGEASERQPRFPLDVADQLHGPVLGLYGGEDKGIPLDTVQAVEAKLQAAGGSSTIHVFADAPHAFHADYRPSFRAEAASEGWRRLADWLRSHGV